MYQRNLKNMSHMSLDISLMAQNVTQDKNIIMISVSVSVKNQ